MKSILFLSLLTLPLTVFSKARSCQTLESCVETAAKLTGKNYSYEEKLKGQIHISKNFKVNKENIDNLVSRALHINGYTRIPVEGGNWMIINARDVRYTPAPILEIGKDQIPSNFDYVMASYKLQNKYISSEITRSLRPFMSRYGRIIDVKTEGAVIIQDTAKNITRLVNLIKKMDRKPSSEEIRKYERAKADSKKINEIKAKNCSYLKTDIDQIKQKLNGLSAKK